MGITFSTDERTELYRVLAEESSDIYLKTDSNGFIVHATPGLTQLGFAMPEMLIGPHLLDLVEPDRRGDVGEALNAAITGSFERGWVPFRAAGGALEHRWFEIRLRALRNQRQSVYGALGVVRSIDDRRSLEDRLFAAEMTDPLTGLTNRKAFMAMLDHLVAARETGCLAIFSIDHLKAINMECGQATGDDVLVSFAELLRVMLRSDDILSRIGGDSFAVMLPQTSPGQAEAVCRRIVETLWEISQSVKRSGLTITASAGLTRIGDTLDSTLKRAELALFHARARGRNRLETEHAATTIN